MGGGWIRAGFLRSHWASNGGRGLTGLHRLQLLIRSLSDLHSLHIGTEKRVGAFAPTRLYLALYGASGGSGAYHMRAATSVSLSPFASLHAGASSAYLRHTFTNLRAVTSALWSSFAGSAALTKAYFI